MASVSGEHEGISPKGTLPSMEIETFGAYSLILK
jgi:hypothetical protein